MSSPWLDHTVASRCTRGITESDSTRAYFTPTALHTLYPNTYTSNVGVLLDRHWLCATLQKSKESLIHLATPPPQWISCQSVRFIARENVRIIFHFIKQIAGVRSFKAMYRSLQMDNIKQRYRRNTASRMSNRLEILLVNQNYCLLKFYRFKVDLKTRGLNYVMFLVRLDICIIDITKLGLKSKTQSCLNGPHLGKFCLYICEHIGPTNWCTSLRQAFTIRLTSSAYLKVVS